MIDPYRGLAGGGVELRLRIDSIVVPGYGRNVLLVIFGSVVGKMVSAAASCILARFFTSEDFGVLGVLTGIRSMLARAASLGCPRAIVLPFSDRDGAGLGWLSFGSLEAISGVDSLLFFLRGDPLARVFLESSAQPGITLP